MLNNSTIPNKGIHSNSFHKLLLVTILFLSSGIALPALAHDVTVNITGKVTNGTCSVSSDSIDKPVYLGSVPISLFSRGSTSSPPVQFTINLENCGTISRGVQVTFTGTPDENALDYFKLSPDSTASGIGIVITDDTRRVIPVGGTSKSYLITDGAATKSLIFYAKMAADGSALKTGTVSSSATFTTAYP
ncbi:fimbrial protein [Hafnia alvei]|uniref:fimbrial protein n=1 Tax=Hafnia alvei TaxID=569 RepID=UPI00345CE668